MQEVVFYAAVSADGYLAGPDGDMSWAEKYLGGDEDYGYYSLVTSCSAMLMGRRTFDFEVAAIGEMERALPTYVLTNEPLRYDGFAAKDVHFVAGDLGMVLDLIQDHNPGRVFLVGGADVVAQAIQAFQQQSVSQQLNFAETFQAAKQQPLGATPLLVTGVRLNHDGDSVSLRLDVDTGQSVTVKMPPAVLQVMLALLDKLQATAQWDVGLPLTDEAAPELTTPATSTLMH